ncbi:restriction endonuclease [Dysgonomonas sp. 25]|uniref:restriction endonuclease n=1 Tax=Dysgonomonas sp. 25 TaxID=2302933 RepID=UPI0013D35F09|nr:restriction endonuclease [Dysgonomonas sp. 25]NDV70380.1 restriction endonuclease [Dysgonomonas sp. 25]
MGTTKKSSTTIIDAISQVLKNSKRPLTVNAIYDNIIANDYYKFKAQNPLNVMRVELRRHCQGVDFPTASKRKHFQILNDGTYCLIEYSSLYLKEDKKKSAIIADEKRLIEILKTTHTDYIKSFKIQLLEQLKDLDPLVFELFSKKLLKVYGFRDMKVTKPQKDGGIDGYGKLKVGISYLNVAFQCKRWKNTSIGRTEIDKFRGAIQGDFEQGIFITTSKFSKEALNATTKKGAVPIILIDGMMIIDIMIEKKFGIEIQDIPLYINALDSIWD